MSPTAQEQILDQLAALRAEIQLAGKLGFTARQAARVTSIGYDEWYRRLHLPTDDPKHVRCVRMGRRMVIPRSELERVMAEAQ